MKVLLAIDDSESSQLAARMVIEQARAKETEVLVLTVLRPPDLLVSREMAGYDATLEMIWQQQGEAAKKLVGSVAGKVRKTGAIASWMLKLGEPPTKILEVAEKWHADLIVMGSPRQEKQDGYWTGGIPETIARRAHCSVEIVRGQQKETPAMV
jgi:nucleotide-binding universal stress UspA family protein